ncbi:MAG: tRNA preQ1(34) S-adenosylmethionine ribosyltransferase-isomerase QueA [Candidatus Omnitrophota bacterium]
MKSSDFNYALPDELIAQYPSEKRDSSRLMVIDKIQKKIEHKNFFDIVDYMGPSDCLVINDTKVTKARLRGKREDTGAAAEFLLLEKLSDKLYKCLVGTSTKIRIGMRFVFAQGRLTAIIRADAGGIRLVEFDAKEGFFSELLEEIGEIPLPPYIKRGPEELDEERYQTVYAKKSGAIAAPTAGLHFTPEVLERAKNKGVCIEAVTLHVGYGTFKPVEIEDINRHKLDAESFEIKEDAAKRINYIKERGGKIFAVGTTVCRVLEYQSRLVKGSKNKVEKGRGWTNLFVYPPYNFKFVDALITNFHLPRTTLIMLVAAFCGKDFLFEAYSQAVKERYRFYSYGDSMLIM